jgi:hypothetical protein
LKKENQKLGRKSKKNSKNAQAASLWTTVESKVSSPHHPNGKFPHLEIVF